MVCGLPFSVRFPEGSISHQLYGAAALHPAQLYASAGGFALFAVFSLWLARAPAPGRVAAGWLIAAGVLRMLVDVYRYYEPSVTLFRVGEAAFTVNTPVALGMVLAGAALWVSTRR